MRRLVTMVLAGIMLLAAAQASFGAVGWCGVYTLLGKELPPVSAPAVSAPAVSAPAAETPVEPVDEPQEAVASAD